MGIMGVNIVHTAEIGGTLRISGATKHATLSTAGRPYGQGRRVLWVLLGLGNFGVINASKRGMLSMIFDAIGMRPLQGRGILWCYWDSGSFCVKNAAKRGMWSMILVATDMRPLQGRG